PRRTLLREIVGRRGDTGDAAPRAWRARPWSPRGREFRGEPGAAMYNVPVLFAAQRSRKAMAGPGAKRDPGKHAGRNQSRRSDSAETPRRYLLRDRRCRCVDCPQRQVGIELKLCPSVLI